MTSYYAWINNEAKGPYSGEQLLGEYNKGVLRKETLVIPSTCFNENEPWKNSWQKLSDVVYSRTLEQSTTHINISIDFTCGVCLNTISIDKYDSKEGCKCSNCGTRYIASIQKHDPLVVLIMPDISAWQESATNEADDITEDNEVRITKLADHMRKSKVLGFVDSGKSGCWACVENSDPIYISIAREGILIKKTRIALWGSVIYKSRDITEAARLCRHLSDEISEYTTPEGMTNPVLMLFTQLALSSSSAAEFGGKIASALERL